MIDIIKLLYINQNVEAILTPTGLWEVPDIKLYHGTNVRNRVICRYDIISGMTDCFSKESIKDYRLILWKMLAGDIKLEQLSKALKVLYKEDETFNLWLTNLYEFNDDVATKPFRAVIEQELIKVFQKNLSTLEAQCIRNAYRTIQTSEGYYYFSVPDCESPIKVPDDFELEVVSSAKVWDGARERYKS